MGILFLWPVYLSEVNTLASTCSYLPGIDFGWHLVQLVINSLNHLKAREPGRGALTITHHISPWQLQVICSPEGSSSENNCFLYQDFSYRHDNRKASTYTQKRIKCPILTLIKQFYQESALLILQTSKLCRLRKVQLGMILKRLNTIYKASEWSNTNLVGWG